MRKKIKKKQIKILSIVLLLVAIPCIICILGNKFENKLKNKEIVVSASIKPISFFLSFENNNYLNETHKITNLKFLSDENLLLSTRTAGKVPLLQFNSRPRRYEFC